MGVPLHLGNDVVDLSDTRHRGKSGDGRFLRRVFTHEERDAILSATVPDQALWIRWAGKEAAYKTVSKAQSPHPPPTFHHALFQVTLFAQEEEPAPAPGSLSFEPPAPAPAHLFVRGDEAHSDPGACWSGEVTCQGQPMALRVQMIQGAVHALTWLPPQPRGVFPRVYWRYARTPGAPEMASLRSRFSAREWSCISHPGSALVRLEARRALARELEVAEEDLEIGCDAGLPGRRIPALFLRGKVLPVDLTLSHAGRFVAWAAIGVLDPA